jgi:hypothetical protein
MAARPPFAVSDSYSTTLDPLQELLFRNWVQANNVPFDVNASGATDYDMRGYFRGMTQGNPQARPTEVNVNDGRPHYTDYYKTPLHQTFSRESQWAGPTAPEWINDRQLVSPGGRILFDEAAQQSPLINLLMGR